MKVLAVADSDSYIKWGASVLNRIPADWTTRMVVLTTPTRPSDAQLADALVGSGFTPQEVPVLGLEAVVALVADEAPDVVLFSVRGPVVRVLVRSILPSTGRRPVFVSGLPGISIPATRKALYYRAQVDLLLLHSRREIREFTRLAAAMGVEQTFGLSTLPFLARRSSAALGDDIVFAAQAKVPRPREDRELVLRWLADTARRFPSTRVVVKMRALAGEQQTHFEKYPYETLAEQMSDLPENLVFEAGPMGEHLRRARGLVTVSSTAAIEAAAMGVPVLVMDDFGVSGDLINTVFDGSGLLGDSRSLLAADFRAPEADWLDDNYFHSPEDEDWIPAVVDLVRRNAAGALPLRPQFRGTLGGNLRRVWDRKSALGRYDRSVSGLVALAIGRPARSVSLTLSTVRRVVRPRRASAPALRERRVP